MDEGIRAVFYDLIHSEEEVIINLLFPQVHAGLGFEPGESGEAQVGVGNVDEFHRIRLYGIL
jgi:hypothetical protein